MIAQARVAFRRSPIALLAISLLGWHAAPTAATTPQSPPAKAPTAPRPTATRDNSEDEDKDDESEDEVIVTSTRRQVLMKDEPIHVESVPTEEIEENLTESPGSVSTVFLELPGMHVESAAPGLGGATMQLRGMPGRNTLVLMDGLPLLGAEPDAFGILQTPPLDLARAEVIKGAASALYGASALGGVLNLVSRLPKSDSSVLASADSHGGRQASAFLATPGESWSGTLMAGVDDQSREDINADGWTDLPYHRRFTLRPRVWWQQGQAQSLFLTAAVMDEERRGGTQPGTDLPDGQAFIERLHTRRFDAGAVSHWSMGRGSIDGHVSFTSTHQDSTFGTLRVAPIFTTAYAEEAWSAHISGHLVALGVAFQHDSLSADTVPGVGYEYNVPALFAQDEFAPRDWLTIAGSVRVDSHNVYGTFASPHLSALLHGDGPWSLRAAVAGGFSAPTPQVDEIQSTSLATLLPMRNLHAERATTASLDLRWASGGWDVNASVFDSVTRSPIEAVALGDRFELINGPGSRRVPGQEIVILHHQGPLETIVSWTRLDARQTPAPGVPGAVPLVPENSARLGSILKLENRGRVGIEFEYTGSQSLEDDPYRSASRGFVEVNALAEIRFGRVRVFANALNLTDVRQTHWDPLLRPTPGPGGNPITDAWAPLAGRTFNAGLRAEL